MGQDESTPINEAKVVTPAAHSEAMAYTTDNVPPPYSWVPKDPRWDRNNPPPITPLRPSSIVLPPIYEGGYTTLPQDILIDKIRGCLFGNALGDAIGLATEFMTKEMVIHHYGDMHSFSFSKIHKDRHRARFPTGDWTDDTDQLLCILDSLLRYGGEIVETDIANRIQYWSYNGYPDLQPVPRFLFSHFAHYYHGPELKDVMGLGLGSTVGQVLDQPNFLTEPAEAAKKVWENVHTMTGRYPLSNGAVMRTSIVGIPWFHSIEETVRAAKRICVITHYDKMCVASCVAVCVAIAMLLRGVTDLDQICHDALEQAFAFLPDTADQEELRRHLDHPTLETLALDDGKAIGYTCKCAGAGFYALFSPRPFKDTILEITREGGDADTNCAVAGAILGCKLGLNALPADFIRKMPHHVWLHNRVDRLLIMMGLIPDTMGIMIGELPQLVTFQAPLDKPEATGVMPLPQVGGASSPRGSGGVYVTPISPVGAVTYGQEFEKEEPGPSMVTKTIQMVKKLSTSAMEVATVVVNDIRDHLPSPREAASAIKTTAIDVAADTITLVEGTASLLHNAEKVVTHLAHLDPRVTSASIAQVVTVKSFDNTAPGSEDTSAQPSTADTPQQQPQQMETTETTETIAAVVQPV